MDIARDLFDTLKSLCALLSEAHVDYCLIGGLAVAILASPTSEATGFVIVDFLLADNEIYREAVHNPIDLIFDKVTIPVASPENLIKIKELSNRSQDLLDIASLKEALKI